MAFCNGSKAPLRSGHRTQTEPHIAKLKSPIELCWGLGGGELLEDCWPCCLLDRLPLPATS